MPTPPKGRFGPGVIGKEAAEAEREYILEHRGIFGPAVLDPHPAEAPSEPAAESEPSTDTEEPPRIPSDAYMMSVAKLEDILAANPLEVDAFLRAELARPEGMRISALKAMLGAENVRPGSDGSFRPRQEVVETLEAMSAELVEAAADNPPLDGEEEGRE